MDEREEQRIRQWIRNWEAVGPVLDRLRDEAMRNTSPGVPTEGKDLPIIPLFHDSIIPLV